MRDHGEILTAARSLLIDCQGYFSNAAASAGDDNRRSELVQVRQVVNSALVGASDNVLNLPEIWMKLAAGLPVDNDLSPLEKDTFLLTSSSICHGIGQALRYRQDESATLYDLPSYDSTVTSHIAPWSSSLEVLQVLFALLQAVQHAGETILSATVNFEADKANLRRFVEDISASALNGYRDIALREPDNDEAVSMYHKTKALAVPLLRIYANDGGDDIAALQASLVHSYFEGVVQICHDHRKSWRFQGSDEQPDERYDLRAMLSSSAASPHAHLHQSRDYETGLPFCGYVLRWYADRGFYPEGEMMYIPCMESQDVCQDINALCNRNACQSLS